MIAGEFYEILPEAFTKILHAWMTDLLVDNPAQKWTKFIQDQCANRRQEMTVSFFSASVCIRFPKKRNISALPDQPPGVASTVRDDSRQRREVA